MKGPSNCFYNQNARLSAKAGKLRPLDRLQNKGEGRGGGDGTFW